MLFRKKIDRYCTLYAPLPPLPLRSAQARPRAAKAAAGGGRPEGLFTLRTDNNRPEGMANTHKDNK